MISIKLGLRKLKVSNLIIFYKTIENVLTE